MQVFISRFLNSFGWLLILGLSLEASTASALDLDWTGQFRAESNYIQNYTLDGSTLMDPAKTTAQGYYIPGGGEKTINFQALFLRLKPSLIVNDNIYIKSEWWVGDPIFGFYGSGVPYNRDERNYYSNQSRGFPITAQRVWGELLTDLGVVQLGRAPLHWGLGLVWNSGDSIWSRYASTGDMIRMVTKFGAFSLSPALVKYGIGNNIGGVCSNTASLTAGICNSGSGGSSVLDYSLALKYENLDEEMSMGVNYVRRISGNSGGNAGFSGIQDPGNDGVVDATSVNYGIWDIYGEKKIGNFRIAGEVPLASGSVGGINYSSFGLAIESSYNFGEKFELSARFGRASGQANVATGAVPSPYGAFYFNPNYKLGMLMFNYQFRNFAGPNTVNDSTTVDSSLVSPYDNPITNAQYLMLSGGYNFNQKWSMRMSWIYASALETATAGSDFFNTWLHKFVTAAGDAGVQSASLGWELDTGVTFKWDQALQFDFDIGFWVPGQFYGFTNTANTTPVSTVIGASFKVGVAF